MWFHLTRAWGRMFCKHNGPKRAVLLGRALPGFSHPLYTICLDCGAVKLEEHNDG